MIFPVTKEDIEKTFVADARAEEFHALEQRCVVEELGEVREDRLRFNAADAASLSAFRVSADL